MFLERQQASGGSWGQQSSGSPCSAGAAPRAAGMEAVPRAGASRGFWSSLFYPKCWAVVCWPQKASGSQECWAWLLLGISKQGSYDTEVHWFLLAFTGFVNEYLKILHQLVKNITISACLLQYCRTFICNVFQSALRYFWMCNDVIIQASEEIVQAPTIPQRTTFCIKFKWVIMKLKLNNEIMQFYNFGTHFHVVSWCNLSIITSQSKTKSVKALRDSLWQPER